MVYPEVLLLFTLFCPLFAAIVLPFLEKAQNKLSFFLAGVALASFFSVCALSLQGESVSIAFSWVPSAGVNFSLKADGLALFFAFLVTGMGALVSLFAGGFMPKTGVDLPRFYGAMALFMFSMLGALFAENSLLFFLFWELTGIASYFLISTHYEEEEARKAARSAFLITSLASLFMLVGFLFLGQIAGSYSFSALTAEGGSSWLGFSLALVFVGIFAKSAQFPFHFWLPEAMRAPTPVSAYLHSATMVKLGIYLLARIYEPFVELSLWLPLVTSLSLVTLVFGGCAALFATSLKKLLAYATISQLGFFISFYGMGDPGGLAYDYLHIFNHALYKGSLFMLVGVAAYAAGVYNISQVRSLAKKLPLWAAAFGLATAAMAGIPGTTGFLSKELLVGDTLLFFRNEPAGILVFAALFCGLLIKVAFSFRLFHALFFGPEEESVEIKERPKLQLLLSPLFLSGLTLVLGVFPKPLEFLSQLFHTEGLHKEEFAMLSLWHGFSLNLLLSVFLFTGGIALFYAVRRCTWTRGNWAEGFALLCERVPEFGKKVTACVKPRRASGGVALALVLTSLPLWATLPWKKLLSLGGFGSLVGFELLIAATSFALCFCQRSFGRLLSLSFLGALITAVFALKSAPDLAMTQMVVEVATLFIFVLLFAKSEERASVFSPGKALLALLFSLPIATLPLLKRGGVEALQLSHFYSAAALPLAKGGNVVNVILVDFRALDTLGEITVIAAALLGAQALLGNFVRPQRKSPLIPSPLLSSVVPVLFVIAALFSLYLLLRGHSAPGGGFIAAVLLAVSYILTELSAREKQLFFLDDMDALKGIFWGLGLASLAALSSLLVGEGFFASLFSEVSFVNKPMLFDIGVFILVASAVIRGVHLMRRATIGEAKWH